MRATANFASSTLMLRRTILATICLLALTGCATAPVSAPVSDRQIVKNSDRFSKLSKDDTALIAVGESAFMSKDAKGAAETVTDDFEWWIVGPEGPKQVVKGRDATLKMISQFLGKAKFDSKVYRLGLVGNILVQVEVDTVQTDKGPVETTSLELYEFKDGKRAREWRFKPEKSLK